MGKRVQSLFLPIIALALSGCSTGSPLNQAINAASRRVSNSVESSYSQLYESPILLEVRRNPCECDPELEFEVNIYGHWRHVFLEGDSELEALRSQANRHGGQKPFEFYFEPVSKVHVSTGGQKFYILRPIVSEQ